MATAYRHHEGSTASNYVRSPPLVRVDVRFDLFVLGCAYRQSDSLAQFCTVILNIIVLVENG